MIKKWFALLLTVVMLFSMVACSKQKNTSSNADTSKVSDIDLDSNSADSGSESIDVNTSTGDTASTNTSKNTTSTSTTSKKGTAAVQSIAADNNKETYVPQMKLSNKSVRMLTTNASHEKYKAYAKEAYGINLDVEVVALSDGLTKLVSYRLANKAPDVVSSGIQPAVYNAGYYQPLDGKINWNHKLWNDASLKAYNEQLKWKNHQYIVGTNRSIDGFIYYNTDMLDEAGLEYPIDLYKKDQWTWDKLLEYAKELTLDPKNTGTPTQYGFALCEAEILLYTTGTHFITMNSKGQAVNNMLSTEVARYMSFHDKLVKSGTLYNGSMSGREAFGTGKVAMASGFWWYTSGYYKMIKNNSFGFAPMPRDPSVKKYYSTAQGGGWAIPDGCKNPDGGMAVINAIRWASTDPAFGAADLKDRYDKGIWNEKLEATYQQLQKEMSGIPIYWAAFNVHNYWGEIWNRAGTSEPWSTVAQSVAPAVDYEIKKIYEAKLEE